MCRSKKVKAPRIQWEPAECKRLIEANYRVAFRFYNDREHRNGTSGAENAVDGITDEKLADALAPYFAIACQTSDQRRRYHRIPRQLPCDIRRDVINRQSEGAKTVETDYAQFPIDRDEYPGNIAPLILARPMTKPSIEFRLAAGE